MLKDSEKILLIIPAYNEEESIEPVVDELISSYPELDYVVVTDGSTDNTPVLCRKRGYNILELPINLGLAGCFQTGMKYAKKHGYKYAVQFDGDGQHDINSLMPLIEPVIKDEKDFVVGSRFLEGTSEFKSTLMRRIGIRYLSFIIKIFARCRVTDPTSGFRAANRRVIKYLAQNYPVDYPEPESLVDLSKRSFRISEVQVNMLEREGGMSSISSWKSIYYMVKVSLAIVCSSLQKKTKED